MYYTIYKITNQINGKIYIGSHKTKNLNDDYMGSGKYLRYSQKKYGMHNFSKEILFIFDNPDDMFKKEKELVSEDFLSSENTYNLKQGGFGGFDLVNKTGKNLYGNNGKLGFGGENLIKGRFRKMTQEEKNKISNTMKEGYKSGKLLPTFKGKTHSDATKKLIGSKTSVHQAGNKNSQYGTMWITNGLQNLKIQKTAEIPDGWVKGRKLKK
ncbi:MAG: hypothetical protein EBU90_24875 [Proteobacteria bacterium]|nr:hypothetical protein [Pseudomonadota bacterium]